MGYAQVMRVKRHLVTVRSSTGRRLTRVSTEEPGCAERRDAPDKNRDKSYTDTVKRADERKTNGCQWTLKISQTERIECVLKGRTKNDLYGKRPEKET